MKLSDTIEGYTLDKSLTFSHRTIENYQRTFDRLITFTDDADIESITPQDIRRFLNYIRDRFDLSDRSIYDAHVALSSLWTWASKELDIPHIIRKVQRPTFTKKVIQPFIQEEIKGILRAAEFSESWTTQWGKKAKAKRPTASRDKALILVLLDSGIRVSELTALRVGDYVANRGILFIERGKGDKERIVSLGNRARKALWRYLTARETGPDDPLFATATNNSMDRHNLHAMLARLGKRAGVPKVHPHRFRHTFAVNFLRNGGNVMELREILGHESVQTLQIYVRLAEIDIEEAQKRASPADKWKL